MAKRKRSDTEGSRQYAAIPIRLRKNGKAEVLLLTSRGKGRWGIPKGWPMRKRSPKGTARQEAFEEAGVKGRVIRHGAILGVIPKSYLPNYREFYEKRHFATAADMDPGNIRINDLPFEGRMSYGASPALKQMVAYVYARSA